MRACLAVRIFIPGAGGVVAGAAKGKSMSATGLEVFDKTVQTTNAWLKEITEATGLDRRRAYRALVLRSSRKIQGIGLRPTRPAVSSRLGVNHLSVSEH
jgi:hypothetical protein